MEEGGGLGWKIALGFRDLGVGRNASGFCALLTREKTKTNINIINIFSARQLNFFFSST